MDKLVRRSLKILHAINVTVDTIPELTVVVTNIDKLRKTGNLEAVGKVKKGFDELFSGLT